MVHRVGLTPGLAPNTQLSKRDISSPPEDSAKKAFLAVRAKFLPVGTSDPLFTRPTPTDDDYKAVSDYLTRLIDTGEPIDRDAISDMVMLTSNMSRYFDKGLTRKFIVTDLALQAASQTFQTGRDALDSNDPALQAHLDKVVAALKAEARPSEAKVRLIEKLCEVAKILPGITYLESIEEPSIDASIERAFAARQAELDRQWKIVEAYKASLIAPLSSRREAAERADAALSRKATTDSGSSPIKSDLLSEILTASDRRKALFNKQYAELARQICSTIDTYDRKDSAQPSIDEALQPLLDRVIALSQRHDDFLDRDIPIDVPVRSAAYAVKGRISDDIHGIHSPTVQDYAKAIHKALAKEVLPSKEKARLIAALHLLAYDLPYIAQDSTSIQDGKAQALPIGRDLAKTIALAHEEGESISAEELTRQLDALISDPQVNIGNVPLTAEIITRGYLNGHPVTFFDAGKRLDIMAGQLERLHNVKPGSPEDNAAQLIYHATRELTGARSA